MEQTKPDITEFYRRVALPLMGLAEVIGTQGRSPGTVAQRSMQQFDTADEIRRRDTEAARKMAMEEALYGQKQEEYGREKVGREKSEANRVAFEKAYKGAGTPEEQNKALEEFLATENPLELARFRLKKENPDLYDILNLELMRGRITEQKGKLKEQEAPKLSEAQKGAVTGVGAAKVMIKGLIDDFKKSNKGTFMQALKSEGSRFPLLGQRAAPVEAAYNAKKRLVAETYLREATGAAAPDKEVSTYMGFLPSLGDTPQQATAKMEAFLGRIRAKAEGVSNYLESVGQADQAFKIRQNVEKALTEIGDINFSTPSDDLKELMGEQ